MSDYSLNQMKTQIQQWLPIAVIIDVIKQFRMDRCTRHAAALSFSSLLALAPLMAIMLAMLSIFSSFEQIGNTLEDFIYRFFLPAAGEDVRQYLDGFAVQAGQLTVVGTVFFLLTALLMLSAIEQSFNDIWRVSKGRPVVQRLTVYWAMVSLGPLLMGSSLALSTYFFSLNLFNDGFASQLHTVGIEMLPFLFEMLAFWLLYLVMPNVKVSLVHGLVGAIVASCLFELTKRLFATYISNFANYEIVYGALSTLPIFLLWVYLCWVVTLIGAEVVSVLQQRKMLEFDR